MQCVAIHILSTCVIFHPIRSSTRARWNIASHPIPLAKRKDVSEIIDKMLKDHAMRESTNSWSSPVILVSENDGLTRLSGFMYTIAVLTKWRWRTTTQYHSTRDWWHNKHLDMSEMVFHVGFVKRIWEVHPFDRDKPAFSVGNGLYHFKVLPFGLYNAPSNFNRLMLSWKRV